MNANCSSHHLECRRQSEAATALCFSLQWCQAAAESFKAVSPLRSAAALQIQPVIRLYIHDAPPIYLRDCVSPASIADALKLQQKRTMRVMRELITRRAALLLFAA